MFRFPGQGHLESLMTLAWSRLAVPGTADPAPARNRDTLFRQLERIRQHDRACGPEEQMSHG